MGLEPMAPQWGTIYSGLRGTDDRLGVLVGIGFNALGEKHFLAIHCPAGNIR